MRVDLDRRLVFPRHNPNKSSSRHSALDPPGEENGDGGTDSPLGGAMRRGLPTEERKVCQPRWDCKSVRVERLGFPSGDGVQGISGTWSMFSALESMGETGK